MQLLPGSDGDIWFNIWFKLDFITVMFDFCRGLQPIIFCIICMYVNTVK